MKVFTAMTVTLSVGVVYFSLTDNPARQWVVGNGIEQEVFVGIVLIFGLMCAVSIAGTSKLQAKVDFLDTPLIWWSKDDPYSVRDLLNGGLLGLGRTGSGKTSGLTRWLMEAIVAIAGSGGLILACKQTDLAEVQKIFARKKRLGDLMIVRPGGEYQCNFIDCLREMGADARAITRFITTAGECIRESNTRGGENGDFFQQNNTRLIHHTVVCVELALGKVTAPDMQRFISTAALSRADFDSEEWRAGPHNQMMAAAYHAPKNPVQQHDYELAVDLFFREWPNMASRTRSSILTGVMGILFIFNSGIVRTLVSAGTNCRPTDSLKGKWIFVDMAPAEYGDSGRFVGAGMKDLVQNAVLRHTGEDGYFNTIWSDEYQNFVTSDDSRYLAECRSHRGCMVVLTQSLHSIFQALPGDAGRERALALISNYSTKVMHCLGSEDDAKFASGLIGSSRQVMGGGSTPPNEDVFQAMMGVSQFSPSFNEQIQPIVQPRVFLNNLRTGGKENGYMVDAIVIKSGEPFADGANFKFVSFNQRG